MEDIRVIAQTDSDFPELLKTIPKSPKKLHAKGVVHAQEHCIAIVGTRVCSPYGKQVALQIGSDLAQAGLTIVSGLAPGIDTWAHKAALQAGGRTIAVLGTGIDEASIYPKENIPLAREILAASGTLLSEYPEGTKGTNFTFPERNRIVSGLSLGVLVIEAKEQSGSLITARLADKQGKHLFAVPGPITSSVSRGTNLAIQTMGATLVQSSRDILEKLGIQGSLVQKATEGENSEEIAVLEALAADALPVDKIIEQTQLAPATIAATLAILEIKGRVRNLGNNIYTTI